MQRNKFLDDIGIPIETYGTNFTDKDDERNKHWKKQRKKYGFDSRECWNLDSTFCQWLYSHLMMYLKDAKKTINLDYHKFTFNNKIYTQKEAIEFILKRLKEYLTFDSYESLNFDESIKKENAIHEEIKDAIRLWAEIYNVCWW